MSLFEIAVIVIGIVVFIIAMWIWIDTNIRNQSRL